MDEGLSISERADALEYEQMRELGDRIVTKSILFELSDGAQPTRSEFGVGTGRELLMGDDARLPHMPAAPTFMDFVRLRFQIGGQQHLLQSANLAQKNGLSEKMVLACLLHDISVTGFLRPDHGYWGAQMIEPYVDDEVSWAIRMHQWR